MVNLLKRIKDFIFKTKKLELLNDSEIEICIDDDFNGWIQIK